MVEISCPRVVFLNEAAICDASGELRLWVWQDLGGVRPFTLRVNDDELVMSPGEASYLASAARSIERSIALADERGAAPRPRLAFHRDLPFDDGTALAFEMGVAAEPAHFFFSWGALRIVPGSTKRDTIFTALETIGDRAAQMPDEGGSSLRLANAGRGAGYRGSGMHPWDPPWL